MKLLIAQCRVMAVGKEEGFRDRSLFMAGVGAEEKV
jgi:hypothetical protein